MDAYVCVHVSGCACLCVCTFIRVHTHTQLCLGGDIDVLFCAEH